MVTSKHIIPVLPAPTLLTIIIAPIKVSLSVVIIPRIVLVLVEDVILGLRIEVFAFFRVAVAAVSVVLIFDGVSIRLILVVVVEAREPIQRRLLGQAQFSLFSRPVIAPVTVWVVPDRFVQLFGEEARFWCLLLVKRTSSSRG